VRALQKTLAIVAFLDLAPQTLRHAYMLWLEPRGSVLDKYDQPVKDEISASSSLDELLRRYDSVHKQADKAREELSREGKSLAYNEAFQFEPYKSERLLKEAVQEWEKRSKEIHALRLYWLAGCVFLVLGLLSYRRLNRWFGLTLLIAAFSEFIYWTSPTFLGDTREFDRLLGYKLALSAVSLVLLITVIWLLHIFAENREPSS